jgi:hypothetical protein
MDEADDLVRSSKLWQEQLEGAKALKPKFHAIRRKLARRLTDCDRSKLVCGSSWAQLEQMDMDFASEALELGSSALPLPNSASSFENLRYLLMLFVTGFSLNWTDTRHPWCETAECCSGTRGSAAARDGRPQ